MRDILGEGTILGYCTNVHAGTTLDQVIGQLATHALAAKARVSPDRPMGVGLWFPATLASSLVSTPSDLEQLGLWLSANDLEVFTLNAFPYGDFHRRRVKTDVYKPTWADAARVKYTVDMAKILFALMPRNSEGSISTLPLSWNHIDEDEAGKCLRAAADAIYEITFQSDRRITLAIEPEPGCQLSAFWQVSKFFASQLKGEGYDRYIGLCHDVCHSAVLFEPQDMVLGHYSECGIRVVKMQLSSAVEANISKLGVDRTAELLQRFDEPRYLHQTSFAGPLPILDPGDYLAIQESRDDLGDAIAWLKLPSKIMPSVARVHFHVPIFLDSLGELGTTQSQIVPAIRAARELHDTKHFEVETYAWNVLPDEHKPANLAEGIARELQWVIDQFASDPPA